MTEMALDCMNLGEQESLQNLSSTQDWFTIENTSYQTLSGTSSLWLTDDLPVSCNFTDSNLFFASEPSIEAQSELGPSPTARQKNFTNVTAPVEPHSLTALSNGESPNIITSSETSLIWVPENNVVSPTSPSASRQTRRVKKGLALVPNASRKRDRLQKDCSSPEIFSPTARRNSDVTRRIPHNEVERKYREGLNASFRKLQCAVPAISQLSDAVIGTARPSKAVVIDSAIEYIHQLEKERDKARFLVTSNTQEDSPLGADHEWPDGLLGLLSAGCRMRGRGHVIAIPPKRTIHGMAGRLGMAAITDITDIPEIQEMDGMAGLEAMKI